ncbi:MAG: mechanosensitive ion channel family protein [Betaproteobacteria bacterium]|nr:MAG: mechanosensitive ion channel family protein [Betaproteobacteria bacterium]
MLSDFSTFLEHLGLSLESILTLLLVAVLGLALAWVTTFLLKRMGKFERARLAAAIAARCAAPLNVLLPVLAMSIALPGLDTSAGVGERLPRMLTVLGIVLAGWLAVRAVRGFVDYFLTAYSIDHADNLEARRMQTQIRVLGRVMIFVVVLVTAAAVMMSIPSVRHIGVSVFASAGIAGLALGLAARPALGNVIAGIQIALTQPIRIEDAVVVEGEWGWIEEIHLTYVVVRIWDLRRLILPISYFIERPFQNWTRTTADILGSVILHMDYSVPVNEIRAEFGRAVRASKHWDGKVEVVHVVDCTDKTMQIRLLMSAANSPNAWELRCAVREHMIGYLQRQYPEALPRIRLEKIDDVGRGAATQSPSDSD